LPTLQSVKFSDRNSPCLGAIKRRFCYRNTPASHPWNNHASGRAKHKQAAPRPVGGVRCNMKYNARK
jgi:hypothetical protein